MQTINKTTQTSTNAPPMHVTTTTTNVISALNSFEDAAAVTITKARSLLTLEYKDSEDAKWNYNNLTNDIK